MSLEVASYRRYYDPFNSVRTDASELRSHLHLHSHRRNPASHYIAFGEVGAAIESVKDQVDAL